MPIALLTTAAALFSGSGLSSAAPNSSDFTVRTRTTFSGHLAVSQSVVLQVKGARQRVVRTFEGPSARPGEVPAYITQCDARRLVLVNDQMRLFASLPLHEEAGPARAPLPHGEADTRPIAETVTIDAVDTGERRPYGALSARRVVTTTTTQRHGDSARNWTRVQDGWYLDLPSPQCDEAGHGGAGGAMLLASTSTGRMEVKWKGTARKGWPISETDRHVGAEGTFVNTTTLVELSEARLDPALFEVPQGYRPSLPLGNRNFDLNKPDTVLNRVRYAVESTASWVHYRWSRLVSSPSGDTVVARKR